MKVRDLIGVLGVLDPEIEVLIKDNPTLSKVAGVNVGTAGRGESDEARVCLIRASRAKQSCALEGLEE